MKLVYLIFLFSLGPRRFFHDAGSDRNVRETVPGRGSNHSKRDRALSPSRKVAQRTQAHAIISTCSISSKTRAGWPERTVRAQGASETDRLKKSGDNHSVAVALLLIHLHILTTLIELKNPLAERLYLQSNSSLTCCILFFLLLSPPHLPSMAPPALSP